jgi:protein TonB
MIANTEFKLKYRKYFDIALSISLALHVLAFAIMPTIQINPYKTETDELEVIEIPPEIEIPPPPKDIARPKIPVETLDEDVEEEETIDDTDLDMDNLPDAPPPPPPRRGDFAVYDDPPKPKKATFPEYPTMAKQAEMEGEVVLKVWVNERGRVTRVEVISSDSPVFNDAAVEAVRQWEFEPAMMSGNPVAAPVLQRIVFKLNR